jgi:hypothetical protein
MIYGEVKEGIVADRQGFESLFPNIQDTDK